MDFLFSLLLQIVAMKKMLACSLFLLLAFVSIAQTQIKVASTIGKISFATKNGSWTLQQYAPNIVKAAFTPKGYITN